MMPKIRIYFFYSNETEHYQAIYAQKVLNNTLKFDIDFRPMNTYNEVVMAQAYGINIEDEPTLIILNEKNDEVHRMQHTDIDKFIEETRGFVLSYEW